jgi:hypothetical protein
MSIASMADGALQRKRVATGGTTQVGARPDTGEAKSRTITPLKGASEIARWIPTEAIALYIAILAGAFGALSVPNGKKLEDLDYTSRWIFYFVMLGVTAALVWLIYAAKNREAPAKAPNKKRNIPSSRWESQRWPWPLGRQRSRTLRSPTSRGTAAGSRRSSCRPRRQSCR